MFPKRDGLRGGCLAIAAVAQLQLADMWKCQNLLRSHQLLKLVPVQLQSPQLLELPELRRDRPGVARIIKLDRGGARR